MLTYQIMGVVNGYHTLFGTFSEFEYANAFAHRVVLNPPVDGLGDLKIVCLESGWTMNY